MAQQTEQPPVAPEGYKLKKKKPIYKRIWFLALAAIVLIVVIVQAAGGTSTSSPSSTSSDGGAAAGDSSAEAAAAGIGTPVRDGKFEFTVTGVDCSQTELGTAPITTTAQGVFCIVSLNVSNIGNEAQYFDASSQVALDAQGREFSADSGAGIYIGDANSFLEQLNPGSAVDGQLVYDVPAGTQLTDIELHDSPFSGGVTVSLG
ncbi:DUF4352 domain-containing protein [Geodermatophilus sp. SYSU D00758]